MQTLNLSSSEIIQTYVYHAGLQQAQFSYSAAIGLFNSVLNLALLLFFNTVARRANQATLGDAEMSFETSPINFVPPEPNRQSRRACPSRRCGTDTVTAPSTSPPRQCCCCPSWPWSTPSISL